MASARVQGMLVSRQNATTAVGQLSQVVRVVIGTAVGAGASLFDDTGRAGSTGTTDALTGAADALRHGLREGPCVTAWAADTPRTGSATPGRRPWRTGKAERPSWTTTGWSGSGRRTETPSLDGSIL